MTHTKHSPEVVAARAAQPGPTAHEHVRRLRNHGGTYRSIAQAAGVGTMTVHDLAAQRGQPAHDTLTAVLRVRPRNLARIRVDAGGTRLRLRALHVMGHGSVRLARATGVSERTIRDLVSGDAKTVSVRVRDIVIGVYDKWWDKRAPERNRAETTAARIARRRAIAGNWCAAAALDDDLLDTRGYKPKYGWRPARGTGVATDLHPRQHSRPRRRS